MRKYNEVVSWPMSKGITVKPSDLSVRSNPKLLPFFDEWR